MSKENVNYQLLGRMVRKVRKKAKLSQSELADLIDVSPQFVSKIENGSKQASLQTVYNIAKSLDVSMDLFMGIEPGGADEKSALGLILADCSTYEAEIIRQIALATKEILRSNEKRREQDNW